MLPSQCFMEVMVSHSPCSQGLMEVMMVPHPAARGHLWLGRCRLLDSYLLPQLQAAHLSVTMLLAWFGFETGFLYVALAVLELVL